MNVKTFIRAATFLLLLFVVLYIGMNNTHRINFAFPLIWKSKITAPAAILYFVMFAIGVIGGLMLDSGGTRSGNKASGDKKR